MNWFDILKIYTKPVDRDRTAPKIKIQPDASADATYDYRSDSINISSNPKVTPEKVARTLAHETTHQAQYNTEPELVKLASESSASFIEFIMQINDIDIDVLTHEDFVGLWRELQPEMERSLKMYFEMLLTIEIQAYSTSEDLDDRQFRINLVNVMIQDIVHRTERIKEIMGMTDERFGYIQTILVELFQPLVNRIATSFVRREKVGQ